MLINTSTQQRTWEHDFKASNPNISFPITMSDADLAPFGYANLNYPTAPTPTASQKVSDVNVIQNIDGTWQVNYQLVDLNPTELAEVAAEALIIYQKSAQDILTSTDSTFARIQEAITLGLTSAQDVSVIAWINYRKDLRSYIKATSIGVLPTKPTTYPSGT